MPTENATKRESKCLATFNERLAQLLTLCFRQLGDLVERVDDYQSLLEDLCLRANEHDRGKIRKALEKVSYNSNVLNLLTIR